MSAPDLNPDLVDLAALNAALARAGAPVGMTAGRFSVDLREHCASTNATLLELAEQGAASGTVLVAHRQSAGRGRRGRVWFAAPGDSLTFSLLWRFAPGTSPAGLSLAVGVALRRALAKVSAGGTALTLKWPNDLLLDGRKLAGVLVELVSGAPHALVIGIGLNLRLPADMPPELRAQAAAWPGDQAPADLLAAILVELGRVCADFSRHGFAPLRAEWQRHHAHQDCAVRLLDDFAPPRQGICRGVDVDGALLLETGPGIERVLAGDVSLRADA